MPNATDALRVIETLSSSKKFRWINTGRESEDWKCKIYQHDGSGLQLAVYNRKTSIVVLLEREVPSVSGTTRLPARPKSHALGHSMSKFADTHGFCYSVTGAVALEALIDGYLK